MTAKMTATVAHIVVRCERWYPSTTVCYTAQIIDRGESPCLAQR